MFRSILLALASLTLIASGCQIPQPPRPSTPAPYITATSPGRPSTPTPVSAPAALLSSPITLTVWLPDALVPSGDTQANALLMQQIAEFDATKSDVHVEALVKHASGPGGILNLIQTAAPVAPSVLPDVALLDLAQIPQVAQAELLSPLNNLMPESVLADLFPYAAAGRFDDRWVAIAYAADMEHLAYNTASIQSPPFTWAQAVSRSLPYLFPAGASGGMPADALLAQYAAAGGRWLDSTGQPFLDASALTQMLRQLKSAQQAGVIPASVLNYSSADETWLTYLASPTEMVDVRAARFVAQRTVISGTMAAPLLGQDEPARSIARGWALVVPVHDPNRLPIAASLVAWLVSAENEGTWTRAANLLPGRRSAFDHWYPADPYTTFVRQELERAISPPPADVAQIIGPAIQKAVADVLRGQAQPIDAATAAAASVERLSR